MTTTAAGGRTAAESSTSPGPVRRLAGPRTGGATEGRVVRRAVVRFAVVGGLSMLLVAVPAVLAIRAIARDHAVERGALNGMLWASTTLAPLVDNDVLAGRPGAAAGLDAAVRRRQTVREVVRVKVWADDGRIVYSDEERLVGRTFAATEAVQEARSSGVAVAEFDSAESDENVFEPGGERFIEVYAPVTAASGDELVFEVYYPDDGVVAEERELLLSVVPVALVALLLLQLAQLPSALVMARRIERDEAARRRLVEQSAAASDLERRRVARDLHDEVIQDLAGVGYTLESLADRVPGENGVQLARARDIAQRDVELLRDMLTEIYPADLDDLGLAGAVELHAAPLRQQGTQVRVRVPREVRLDRTASTLLYRVAREALTNVDKHAAATRVDVVLEVGPRAAVLTVSDDGAGFDTAVPRAPGHVGLSLVRDTVREAGGELTLTSVPGHGTSVVASLPLA